MSLSSGYNLPPGCFERDLPGYGETHHEECPWHEGSDAPQDTECVCSELDAQAKADAEEMKFELSREES